MCYFHTHALYPFPLSFVLAFMTFNIFRINVPLSKKQKSNRNRTLLRLQLRTGESEVRGASCVDSESSRKWVTYHRAVWFLGTSDWDSTMTTTAGTAWNGFGNGYCYYYQSRFSARRDRWITIFVRRTTCAPCLHKRSGEVQCPRRGAWLHRNELFTRSGGEG